MCTLTWWLDPDGASYEVFCNRDELRTRAAAAPPTLARNEQVDYLAPTDADFGGTWLLVNAHALTLALINHYPLEPKKHKMPARSRGLLLRDLSDCASIAEVRARLEKIETGRYSAFFILAFERGQKPRKWTWNTHVLLEDPAAEPLPFFTSSSFRSEDVRRHRREEFAKNWAAKGLLAPPNLAEFHLYRNVKRPAFGVMMDRSDAQTVSYSHIIVGPGSEALFSYQTREAEKESFSAPPLVTRLQLTAPAAGQPAS